MANTHGTPSVSTTPTFYKALRSPGRFFAANELKAMLAFIVVNYDLKLAGDGKRPQTVYFGSSIIPSPNGKLMFRKRQGV